MIKKGLPTSLRRSKPFFSTCWPETRWPENVDERERAPEGNDTKVIGKWLYTGTGLFRLQGAKRIGRGAEVPVTSRVPPLLLVLWSLAR